MLKTQHTVANNIFMLIVLNCDFIGLGGIKRQKMNILGRRFQMHHKKWCIWPYRLGLVKEPAQTGADQKSWFLLSEGVFLSWSWVTMWWFCQRILVLTASQVFWEPSGAPPTPRLRLLVSEWSLRDSSITSRFNFFFPKKKVKSGPLSELAL